MRVGLFGGSFDPIHCGHIEPVIEARRRLDLDVVLYLPTAQPPHKKQREFAPALARYAMVEIALLPHSRLRVSTHELTLGRPAYTVETLEHFAHELPGADLYLLLGSDSYHELDQWRRWRDLLRLARLVVLERPGAEQPEVALPPELRDPDPERVLRVENRRWDVSSTEIRAALARGERLPEGVLPPSVLDYCSKYGLYGPSASAEADGNR